MARPRKIKEEEILQEVVKEESEEQTTTVARLPRARKKAKLACSPDVFDIFADDSVADQTRSLLAKASLADGFKSAADISRDYLPLPWPAMQYLIGRIGIPVNTIIEFIGQENTGKSSLVMSMLGNFIKYNIPCLFCNSEPKMLESDWISRLVGADARLGDKVKRVLEVTERLYTLDDMDKLIRKWVQVKRYEQGIPKSVPLVCVVDTITKLLNPEEAEAMIVQEGKDKSINVLKNSVADISKKPGVTAKWLHEWTRAITSMLNEENVTIICVSGQNQNMNAGPAGSFAPDGGASLNKTRIGGTAMNQSASIQITITRKGIWKDSAGNQIGDIIRARVVKNSYGPKRSIEYGMRNDLFVDDSGYIQQAIDMDEAFANILVANKIKGLSCTRKLYSSEAMNVQQLKAPALIAKITSDEALMDEIGALLKISGYELGEDS